MPVSPCANIRQLCQYTCLIQTLCNQQCDQGHYFTSISHCLHMPATFHIHVPLHVYCSLHIDPKPLHSSKIQQKCNFNLPCYCHVYPSNAICPNYMMCINVENYLNKYTTHELTAINHVTRTADNGNDTEATYNVTANCISKVGHWQNQPETTKGRHHVVVCHNVQRLLPQPTLHKLPNVDRR